MNERIRELAEQAGLQQRTWRSLGRDLPMWQEDPDNPGLAKFAELIVQECASMSRVYHSHEYDFTGDLELDEFMLKHFGVEE